MTSTPPTAARLGADAALLAVAAVWGATFVMVKDALAFAGPFAFLSLRFSLAAALLVVAAVAVHRRDGWSRGLLAAGSLLGAALFGGYALQTVGLQFTTPARAGFVTGISVVIVPLLSALVLRRAVARGVWTGVALATVGLGLLSLGPELFVGGPLIDGRTLAGDLLVLGCALSFAAQIVLLGEFAPRYPTIPLTALQVGGATVLSLLFTLGLEPTTSVQQIQAILPAAVFTGVFATVAAFTAQTRAQQLTTPAHTALIFSTEPVFGALFAYLLAGETLGPAALAGCALILAGMVVAQVAELR